MNDLAATGLTETSLSLTDAAEVRGTLASASDSTQDEAVFSTSSDVSISLTLSRSAVSNATSAVAPRSMAPPVLLLKMNRSPPICSPLPGSGRLGAAVGEPSCQSAPSNQSI